MTARLGNISGFSLIEVVIAIVVLGIVAGIAMQSMTASVDDVRKVETVREMDMLTAAIVGDPSLRMAGTRADFGYVGDIGAFPPDLQALSQNPGAYSTWNGPYIAPGFTQDVDGFEVDAWGRPYAYSGGITITSNGGGSAITKKIADASSDYLLNVFHGYIRDAADSVPGVTYRDSVEIEITIPDGLGGTRTKIYAPDSAGAFTLDSLPVGTHRLRFIFVPMVDTLSRYLTILPRQKSQKLFKFASAYFTDDNPAVDSTGLILSTTGSASLSGLGFQNEDAVFYDRFADTSAMFFDGSIIFSDDEDIDAIHILGNGHSILSTTGQARIGALNFDDDDLIEYNPTSGTATLYMDGGSVFTGNENIDAVYIFDNGDILLSTTGNARIGSLNFGPEDLVRYEPVSGNASLFFDGSAAFADNANVDAAHVLANGHIVLSAEDATETIGSLTFGSEDLVEYDPSSGIATMFFDGDGPFGTTGENIDAACISDGGSTLGEGLVGHWPMDDDSGLVAHNSSMLSSDADLQNDSIGSGWTAGQIAGAFEFDGVDDFFRTPTNATQLQMTDDYSISVWIFADSVQNEWAGICSKNTPSGDDNQWTLQFDNSSGTNKKITVYHPAGNRWISNYRLSDCMNAWHHLIVTYRHSPARVQLFVDGVLHSESTSLTRAPGSGNGKLHIGAERIEIPFKGKIDDLRIYNRVLIPGEIAALYHMGS